MMMDTGALHACLIRVSFHADWFHQVLRWKYARLKIHRFLTQVELREAALCLPLNARSSFVNG
jgi:hypothetical protein